jgi:hypothetical protein
MDILPNELLQLLLNEENIQAMRAVSRPFKQEVTYWLKHNYKVEVETFMRQMYIRREPNDKLYFQFFCSTYYNTEIIKPIYRCSICKCQINELCGCRKCQTDKLCGLRRCIKPQFPYERILASVGFVLLVCVTFRFKINVYNVVRLR